MPLSSAMAGQETLKNQEAVEWTEIDESGTVKHVIQKTTHMTLCMHQKSDETLEEYPISVGDEGDSGRKYPDTDAVDQKDVFRNYREVPSLEAVKDISDECLEISDASQKYLDHCAREDVANIETIVEGAKIAKSESELTKEMEQDVAYEKFHSATYEGDEIRQPLKMEPIILPKEVKENKEREDSEQKVDPQKEEQIFHEAEGRELKDKLLLHAEPAIQKQAITQTLSDNAPTADDGDTSLLKSHPSTDENDQEYERIKVRSGCASSDGLVDTVPSTQHEIGTASQLVLDPLADGKYSEENAESFSAQQAYTTLLECQKTSRETQPFINSSEHSIIPPFEESISEPALEESATESDFIPLAFDNTAFVGADLIDASEISTDSRSRSPYEVLRDESDACGNLKFDYKSEVESFHSSNTNASTDKQQHYSFDDARVVSVFDQITENKRSVIRKRPLLQQIPSEISEEDLVETDMSSPTSKSDSIKIGTSNCKTTEHETTSIQMAGLISVCQQFQTDDVATGMKDVSELKSEGQSSKEISLQKLSDTDTDVHTSQSIEMLESSMGSGIKVGVDYQYRDEDPDVCKPQAELNFELYDAEELESRSGAVGFSGNKSVYAIDKHYADNADEAMMLSFQEKQFVCASDETIDAEIGKIINYDIQSEEDIIERPQTPEPPLDSELYVEDIEKYESQLSAVTLTSTDFCLGAEKQNDLNDGASAIVEYPEQIDMLVSLHDDSIHEDDFEIIEDSEVEALRSSEMSEIVFEGERSNLRKMGSFKDITTVHLNCLEEDTRDLDGAFASSSIPINGEQRFTYGMQFEKDLDEHSDEAMDIDNDEFSEEKEVVYAYGMRFERDRELEDDVPCYGDLYTHHEEDEDAVEEIDKNKPAAHSKTDFDILAGRKFFSKNGELDDVSVSSLQEFERLEEEFRSGRRSSIGSVDSLNGKHHLSKSGEHDDVSMNSLTEFEKLEREFTEAERTESIAPDARLSEIEEGHESQTSEASQETLSDAGKTEPAHRSVDYMSKFNELDGMMLKNNISSEASVPIHFTNILDTEINTDENEPICIEYNGDKLLHSVELTDDASGSETKTEDCSKTQHQAIFIADNGNDVSSKSAVLQVKHIDEKAMKIDKLHLEKKETEDDVEQDSLHEDKSLKPDSLSADDKCEYLDSLHEDKTGDVDSLQDDVPDDLRDSLREEKPIDEDSLHEMDILPDESSLSLESSLAVVIDVSHDSLSERVESHQMNTEKDFDADSLKGVHLGGTIESVFPTHGVEANACQVVDLISSTDSLEQCSSAALHATYQYETESLMSSSLNSVQTTEDYTMVSVSESLEPDASVSCRGFPGDGKSSLKDDKQFILDAEGNIRGPDVMSLSGTERKFHEFLKMKEEDLPFSAASELDSSRIAKYNGEDVAENIKCSAHNQYPGKDSGTFFFERFDPDVEIEEVSTVDEYGNSKVVRKIKKIMHTTHSYTSGFSPQKLEQDLGDFVKVHEAGKDSRISEEEVKERTFDDKGNLVIVRTVQHQMTTEPVFYCKTFSGPNAQKCSDEFLSQFHDKKDTENVEEYQDIDEDGNITRVTKQVVVKPEISTLTFTGPDASHKMEDFIKQWNERGTESSSDTKELVSERMSVSEGLQIKQENISQHQFYSTGSALELDCGSDVEASQRQAMGIVTETSRQPETSDHLVEEKLETSRDLLHCKEPEANNGKV